MAKVNDIVVETDGACFLCCRKVSTQHPQVKLESGVRLESESTTLYSLQLLSRYLRMDMRKVFNDKGPLPPALLGMIENSNLKVELCEGCASITDNFSKGYHQLKKIELELMSYVSLIQERLMKSEESCEPYHFNELISPSLISIMGFLEKQRIVKVLRTETMEKCSRKLGMASPRVELKNLGVDNVDSVRTKLKFNSTDNSPLDVEVSEPGTPNSKMNKDLDEVTVIESCATLNSDDTGTQPEPTMETVGLSIELGEVKLHQEFGLRQDTTDIERGQQKCPKSKVNESEPFLEMVLGDVKVDQPSISQNDNDDHPPEDTDMGNEDIPQVEQIPTSIINCNEEFAPEKRKTRSEQMSPNKRICKTSPNVINEKGTFEVTSSPESLNLVGPSGRQPYTKDPDTGLCKCSICLMTFTAISGFNYHYKSVHLKLRFKCSLCKKEFQHQRSYKRHYESDHLGVTFKCEFCDKVCSLKSNLIKHQQGVHFGKRFQCPLCSKLFVGSSTRTRHMRKCPMKKPR